MNEKHEKFLKELELRQPKIFREVKIMSEYTGRHDKILVKDKYGESRVVPNSLLSAHYPTIQSALNKSSYWINMAKEVHGDCFDYSDVNYISANKKVCIICKIHGDFMQTPNAHINGQGCHECSKRITKTKRTINNFKKEFQNKQPELYDKIKIIGKYNGNISKIIVEDKFGKALVSAYGLLKGCPPSIKTAINKNEYLKNMLISAQGQQYDYSKVKYNGSGCKITINCPIHGEFEQFMHSHLNGSGCKLCADKLRYDFTLKSWLELKNSSDRFDSYKLYKIHCWDGLEDFYKIGITSNTIYERFKHNNMPYNYDIIEVIESDDGLYIWELEKELHRKHTDANLNYIPKLIFGGYTECFKVLL